MILDEVLEQLKPGKPFTELPLPKCIRDIIGDPRIDKVVVKTPLVDIHVVSK